MTKRWETIKHGAAHLGGTLAVAVPFFIWLEPSFFGMLAISIVASLLVSIWGNTMK